MEKRATSIGFAAIILWSTMVGLIRGVSEGLGPVGGAAMIYSLSGLLLIFTVGFPNLRQVPRRYLLAGSVLFVSYGSASPCRWVSPPPASRLSKWGWSIICGPA